MKLDTQRQIDAAERTLRLTWVIVAGAVIFSVLTVTPLVQRVTPEGWKWTAPILPIVVDVAVVIVVRVDAIVARLDGKPGFWPALLRWLTGAMTLLLNIGDSALKGDLVGVGVHAVAPVLLIVTAEASLKWRRAITAAVARIDRERADAAALKARERKAAEDRSRADREAREAAQTAERERQRQADADERERARAHEARIEQQRLEREDARAAADRAEAARRRQEERDERERVRQEERDREDRERKAQEAAQKAERDRKAAEVRRPAPVPVSAPRPAVSAAVSTPRPVVSATAHETPQPVKMSESDARQAVADALREGRSQRAVAALTGWSTGWVAKQFKELEAEGVAA